jgi:formylmethanofuran dehydrogenase subunit C
MSDIVLTLKSPLTGPTDLSCVRPDRMAELDGSAIGALPVWSAAWPRRSVTLGDLFRIEGSRTATVTVRGDCRLADGIGRAMTAGRLTIEGDTGRDAGAEMHGGSLMVTGSAGANLGGAVPGASRGMTGGEIVVMGSVGAEVGFRMRRGLIFVGGRAGERPGRSMIAGTLVIAGTAGQNPGLWSKRGSLVALGEIVLSEGYAYACTYRPPHLPIILTRLRAAYGAALTDAQIGGMYRRYSGDLTELGKGEILAWTAG